VDPWHYEAACANLDGLRGGVLLYDYAVVRSDEAGRKPVHYDGKWNTFGNEGPIVKAVSLDEIVDAARSIRFLKIDCEGSEWPILYTCTKLDQIQEIAGEYHEHVNFHDDTLPPTKIYDLMQFLANHGFVGEYHEGAPGIGNFWVKRAG
jgi:hypothetical protein